VAYDVILDEERRGLLDERAWRARGHGRLVVLAFDLDRRGHGELERPRVLPRQPIVAPAPLSGREGPERLREVQEGVSLNDARGERAGDLRGCEKDRCAESIMRTSISTERMLSGLWRSSSIAPTMLSPSKKYGRCVGWHARELHRSISVYISDAQGTARTEF
jgi:hypothetical protein